MVNGRRDDRAAQSRMIIDYGGPLDRGTLIDGRSGFPSLRYMNPGWHVDHRGQWTSLRYKPLPNHLWVLAANIGRLDASTTGDRSMRKA